MRSFFACILLCLQQAFCFVRASWGRWTWRTPFQGQGVLPTVCCALPTVCCWRCCGSLLSLHGTCGVLPCLASRVNGDRNLRLCRTQADDELPERLIGSVRFEHLDLKTAAYLDDESGRIYKNEK